MSATSNGPGTFYPEFKETDDEPLMERAVQKCIDTLQTCVILLTNEQRDDLLQVLHNCAGTLFRNAHKCRKAGCKYQLAGDDADDTAGSC